MRLPLRRAQITLTNQADNIRRKRDWIEQLYGLEDYTGPEEPDRTALFPLFRNIHLINWFQVRKFEDGETRDFTLPEFEGATPACSSYYARISAPYFLTNVVMDTDGDGLPDDVEMNWSGTTTGAVASADSDGDGATDWEEYMAGTNPKPGEPSATFSAGCGRRIRARVLAEASSIPIGCSGLPRFNQDKTAWARDAVARLKRWNFTPIAAWSDEYLYQNVPMYHTRVIWFGDWGRNDARLIDVFSPASAALGEPYILGFDWFMYHDQPPAGRFDGENSNYGLVDIQDRPYTLLLGGTTVVVRIKSATGCRLGVGVNESGVAPLESQTFAGWGHADGASYKQTEQSLKPNAEEFRATLALMEASSQHGNQRGNKCIDMDAIQSIHLYFPGGQPSFLAELSGLSVE